MYCPDVLDVSRSTTKSDMRICPFVASRSTTRQQQVFKLPPAQIVQNFFFFLPHHTRDFGKLQAPSFPYFLKAFHDYYPEYLSIH